MLYIPVVAIALIVGLIMNVSNKPNKYNYNEAYKDSYLIIKYINECFSIISPSLLKDYKQALKDNRITITLGKAEYDANTNKLTYNSKAI